MTEIDLKKVWDDALDPLIPRAVSIIEFAENPQFCGLKLYPHQRLALKLYNKESLDEWEREQVESWYKKGYLPPDIWDRIDENPFGFREAVLVIGRRGSKTLMAAIIACYETYKLLLKHDPHKFYNILPGEPIQVACIADSGGQADETTMAKIYAIVQNNPWMLDRMVGNKLHFQTDADRERSEKLWIERGLKIDQASVVIRSYNARSGSARGRALIAVIFDEIAHYQNMGGRDNAYNLYEALTPATTDFGKDGKIVSISSPLYEFGQFYDLYTAIWSGRKRNAIGFQIPSWVMYENAEQIGARPKFTFDTLKKDSETVEYGTPEWDREYAAKFQKNISLYMNPDHIERMFEQADEFEWDWQNARDLQSYYHIHGDPAAVHAGFPVVVAHYDSRYDKVFVDFAHRWRVLQNQKDRPLDNRETVYPVGEIIDYEDVEETCKELIDKFLPRTVTFDQWNSIGSIQRLTKYVRHREYDHIKIREEGFYGKNEKRMYEKLRTELANERVVCPWWPILSQELNNVVDNGGKIRPPGTGPVQTKDAADCLAVVVSRCLEDAEKGRLNRKWSGPSVQKLGGVPVSMPKPAVVRGRTA